jgi:hypothetical protein
VDSPRCIVLILSKLILCFSCSNPARRNNRHASREFIQFVRSKNIGEQINDGTNPIFIWTKQQNTRVFAWRVCLYVSKTFIGGDEQSVFFLNGFPERGVFPSTHLLVNYAYRIIAVIL